MKNINDKKINELDHIFTKYEKKSHKSKKLQRKRYLPSTMSLVPPPKVHHSDTNSLRGRTKTSCSENKHLSSEKTLILLITQQKIHFCECIIMCNHMDVEIILIKWLYYLNLALLFYNWKRNLSLLLETSLIPNCKSADTWLNVHDTFITMIYNKWWIMTKTIYMIFTPMNWMFK